MKNTIVLFVRELATNSVAYHEIREIDTNDLPPAERAKLDWGRMEELMLQYPSSKYEVFKQGFSSLSAFYGAWPELAP